MTNIGTEMHKVIEMTELIADLCRRTLDIAALGDDDDFFDHGANSLTIVELQIRIEKELDLKVPTSQLMLDSSIAGWIGAYQNAARSTSEAVAS
jgi:D-alanine--poly(phosphoribitol) ligase subunit 2